MKSQTLSVIIANYNHAHYISEALEAILNQSFRPKEVIVVDDGSTDNSVEIIQKFVKRDPITVCLLQNKKNSGVIFSQNKALQIASGDYVYFAASDDFVLPDFFEKSINLLAKYPQAGLCFTEQLCIDAEGTIYKPNFNFNPEACFFPPEEFIKLVKKWQEGINCLERKYIVPFSVIIRRDVVLEQGGLMLDLKWHADWFAALVTAFRYGACYIPEGLVIQRIIKDSYSAVGMRTRGAQLKVLKHVLYLLNSKQYDDVRNLFKIPSAMYVFGSNMLFAALSRPAYWRYISFRFVLLTAGTDAFFSIRRFKHHIVSKIKRIIWRVFKVMITHSG